MILKYDILIHRLQMSYTVGQLHIPLNVAYHILQDFL